MEDLITDLLSQPVDVSDWLPAWVHEVGLAWSAGVGLGWMWVLGGWVGGCVRVWGLVPQKGWLCRRGAAEQSRSSAPAPSVARTLAKGGLQTGEVAPRAGAQGCCPARSAGS